MLFFVKYKDQNIVKKFAISDMEKETMEIFGMEKYIFVK
jgi:hypothetical protein